MDLEMDLMSMTLLPKFRLLYQTKHWYRAFLNLHTALSYSLTGKPVIVWYILTVTGVTRFINID